MYIVLSHVMCIYKNHKITKHWAKPAIYVDSDRALLYITTLLYIDLGHHVHAMQDNDEMVQIVAWLTSPIYNGNSVLLICLHQTYQFI